jgi:inosine-uridine nucleoside N-ribohydrolase
MIRLVIDTDPGVDDAVAILAAFAHPEARGKAITTVAGNVSLERTTANACTILDVLEQNVPDPPVKPRSIAGSTKLRWGCFPAEWSCILPPRLQAPPTTGGRH